MSLYDSISSYISEPQSRPWIGTASFSMESRFWRSAPVRVLVFYVVKSRQGDTPEIAPGRS